MNHQNPHKISPPPTSLFNKPAGRSLKKKGNNWTIYVTIICVIIFLVIFFIIISGNKGKKESILTDILSSNNLVKVSSDT